MKRWLWKKFKNKKHYFGQLFKSDKRLLRGVSRTIDAASMLANRSSKLDLSDFGEFLKNDSF